ncbi:DNA-binding protein [Streptomyces sp. NPDC101181]|uniref:DNA-binding protein n=1 Tax=Streptomyces sp. NPDC101181 TaxID=3366125 RepID=UPI0037F909C6
MADRPAGPQDEFPHAVGRPARGALRQAGYTRLAQLTEVTSQEVLALHGVGPRAIVVLREALAAQGRSFNGE